jgi:uncharacterized protein (TIGR02996 family)
MHPELLALLATARREPEDPTARLVLADWLEENGDEAGRARAAFIRAQIECSRLPAGSPVRKERERQAVALRRRHRRTWLGGLARVRGLQRWDFERGLVRLHLLDEVVDYGGLPFLARHDGWAWVNGLICVGPAWLDEARLGSLAYSDPLADIQELNVSRPWPFHQERPPAQGGFHRLVASPHAANLRSLGASSLGCGDTGAQSVASSPHLQRLTSLSLANNQIGPAGASALAGSATLSALTSLDLGGNRLGSEGVLALLEAPWLSRLQSLALYNNDLDDPGALALASSPRLDGLKTLTLHGNQRMSARARSALQARFGRGVSL